MFQIANVNKALGSVAYTVDRAYRVVFDKNMETGEDMSYMTHKATKKTYRFRRERNVWILDASRNKRKPFRKTVRNKSE